MVRGPKHTPLDRRTTRATLERWSAEAPGRPALRQGERCLTYGELPGLADRIAAGIGELGLPAGARVLTMMDNHVDHILLWLGLSASPYVELPANTAYKGTVLAELIEHGEPTLAIVDDHYCRRLAELSSGLTTVVVRGGEGPDLPSHVRRVPFEQLTAGEPGTPHVPNAWDVQSIMYTSGTTGRSKGVAVREGHAFSSACAYPQNTGPQDVALVGLPLFHVSGRFAGVYNTLIGGGTAVIGEPFSASRFWAQVAEIGATSTILVGGMAEFLWQQPARPDDTANSLRRVGIVPGYARLDDFRHRFGVTAESVYGSTEVGSVLIGTAEEANSRACGRPRDDVTVRLVDEFDREVEPGAVGELLVRSDEPWSMISDYYRNPEATAAAWRNGWFHTGDAMYVDTDGQYCFSDRNADGIRRRGENVSSFTVEARLLLRPEVQAVAVVGLRTEHEDDEVRAFLVLEPERDIDRADVIRALAEELPYFMVPRYLDVVDALPMTPTLRVQKAELRARPLGPDTWDREAAGISVTRHGVTTG